ncbi:IS1182 family transposase [Nocardia sp. NPDC023852]|uniref:IS1182 family transposase n=1 Tax=Nocardia sp. NPDC023852 TaxID=3154697 RepID=UPI0033FAB096
MTLGRVPSQGDLLRSTVEFCAGRVGEDSIYGVLHRECVRLFPDEMFADLFTDVGRRSVPPMIVAVVMVLQRVEGLSDREAVERFAFDARWKYAAGGLDFDYPGFVHTVLVDMRARLARSERPNRIFDTVLQVAHRAGLVGRRRVLDSTPLYDAVATMDTITLVRSAIRGLLTAADAELATMLRARVSSGDDYASAAKPVIDWDDEAARAQLIDSRAGDAMAMLAVLDGCELDEPTGRAAQLLATVVGQDIAEGDDGCFRIVRGTAADRVISTVDPETRHGHKTSARGFDGYKGHLAVDPDSEIIAATTVTPGNAGDADAAEGLLADILPAEAEAEAGGVAVFGDAACGAGEFLKRLDDNGIGNRIKGQPSPSVKGYFAKDRFTIDLDRRTVTCPAGVTATIGARTGRRTGTACLGVACTGCPLRAQCTTAAGGRTITVGAFEEYLVTGRERQRDPAWKADYRATRPKVERKIGHLMRRRHGGRRARMRGRVEVAADFGLLAAAHNLARLAVLGIAHTTGGWTAAPA